MAVIVAVASACVFDRDPLITCEDTATADCERAVEMARPLMRSYWDQAGEVHIHPGGCVRSRSCRASLAQDPGFMTVDLVSEQPEAASVVIDRHDTHWTATCYLTVPDANGAHGEPCEE